MLFFGWGKRNISKVLSETQSLILTYGYFDLFFVFSVAFRYRYSLATKSENGWSYKDITKQEADSLLKGDVFQPHWWWRYSLYGFVALIVLLGIFNSFFATN